jgi:hypothetical protein
MQAETRNAFMYEDMVLVPYVYISHWNSWDHSVEDIQNVPIYQFELWKHPTYQLLIENKV